VGVISIDYPPGVSSKLARHGGRLVVVTTTPGDVVPAGTVLYVLGNNLECAGLGVGFLGVRTGRPSDVTPATVKREPDVEQRCEECGQRYTIAARNARRGARPRCQLCRGIPAPATPTAADFDYWTTRLNTDELHHVAGAFAA
jgi:hypothetical protein